jgi:hypothetical protein
MTMNELVIYSNKYDLKQGMFGQALIWFLEVLNDLEQTAAITNESKVVFDINAEAYDNIIPTFVQPKIMYNSSEFKQPKLLDMTEYFMKSKKTSFEFDESSFADANRLWNKYFEFSDDVLKRTPQFDGPNTLGLHYRGTDKNVQYNEANAITQQEFIEIVLDFLVHNPGIKYIYCCSDEQSFVKNLRAVLPYNVGVIEYIRERTVENVALHRLTASDQFDKELKYDLTLSAFVDMLALSRCSVVLKTNSALSAFSKIINPDLQIYTANAMKERWFPTGVVRPYKTNTKKINDILKKTMVGHIFV